MQRHHPTPYQRLQPKKDPDSAYMSPTGDQDHLVPVQKYAPPSMYHPHLPCASQPPPAYSVQRPTIPSYSAQALKTFAPQQMAYTPDAAMVPIHSLRSEKSFVVRRTIRVPEVKAFPDRSDPGKHKWLLSFTIKDDLDTIDIKFWHKTKEHLDSYSHITLDQVVHVWTDEVKLNTKPFSTVQGTSVPTTSSPFCLTLGEGKIGQRIDIGNETEMITLFKTALGANIGGVVACISIKQVMAALSSVGGQRFNLVICMKSLVSSGVITSKNGPLTKTLLKVFDAQGQEASMVLWGEALASVAQKWVSLNTRAQVGLYNMMPQIKIGYQTHIQVDPLCKNVEVCIRSHAISQA
ncbi:hypothetical protein BGZ58_001956 [Dissophora ornata]|nr:hypothetical protein BGZ58_001956 [Dissophora ornata]